MGGNGHDLLLAAVCIVSPAEGDAVVFKSDEPMVGDGHAMAVAGQVVEDMLRPAERRLGVDHPVLAAEFPQELDECVRRGKLLKRAMELESVLLEEFTKPGAELTAEAPAKRLNGQEEAWRGIDPSGTVESQAAGGNDVMDIGMMFKILSPGMERPEESDVRSQVLRIASQFEHCRGAGAIEQVVEQPLVLENESGQLVRQSEDNVEIRNGQRFSRARRQACTTIEMMLEGPNFSLNRR